MFKGIVGYTAVKKRNGVLLEKVSGNWSDTLLATTWEDATAWLTESKGVAFHVVWDLQKFTEVLFTLLPTDAKRQLEKSNKVVAGNTKIFYVGKLLGLTTAKHLKGNIYEYPENNFYAISKWLNGVGEPVDAIGVARYGEQIVEALGGMQIYTDKLTSPVGAFTDTLLELDLPTLFTTDKLDAPVSYCLPIMRNEWRSAYKLGYFNKAWVYDIRAAYPSIMAELPNTDKCKVVYSDTYVKSDWAIMRGKVEVTADISPIVIDTGNGYITPAGKWDTMMTLDEAVWLKKNGVGRFTMTDGYFFNWLSRDKPYNAILRHLFGMRDTDNQIAEYIAKNMAQGCSGKLDQDNPDGTLGELYNPVLACMTRSRCRLKVADFIYQNKLQDNLLAVMVDSCVVDRLVQVNGNNAMGEWRLDAEGDALILGKGEIWRTGKKPLAIDFEAVVEAMRQHPSKSYYQFGKKYFDLSMMAIDTDRLYSHFPENGGEALSLVSGSKPILIEG